MTRRVASLTLAVALVATAGCASALRARGATGDDRLTAADVERFQPDQLIDQRQRLKITDAQFTALQTALRDRVNGRRTPYEAAEIGFKVLTDEQRTAVRLVAPRHGHH